MLVNSLRKNLLGHIVSHRLIAAVMKGDRVNSIFVGFEQVVKGIPIALFAGLDDFSLCLAIANYL